MALSTIAITQGTGTPIEADSSASGYMQVIKLAESVLGSTSLIPASTANGLTVDVTRIAGTVTVVQATGTNLKVDASGTNVPVTDAGGTLTVDAPAGTPVAVRLSTGSAFIDTVPVSIAGTVTVAGTVAVSGTAAVTQSGTWNVAALTSITNTVTISGAVTVSGTPTIQGTVTGNQGTAAAVGSGWYVRISDGTNSSTLQDVGGVKCVPVKVLAQTGGGYSQVDKTTFTEGTTEVEVIGGVYNDGFSGDPAAGQASVARITAKRAIHVNIRKNDGTELGIAATPLRVDPTGSTTQPVSGTVTANQGGSNWTANLAQVGGNNVATAASGIAKAGVVDASGNAFSAANPLPVQNAPSSGFWKAAVTYSASQTDQAIRTPGAGKTAYVEGIIITVTAVGVLKVYDQTNAAAGMIFQGSPIAGTVVITPSRPIPLSAVNNILRYSTGTAATGDITAWGYEV